MPLSMQPHLRAVAPYVPGKPVAELERELGIASAIKLASNESPLGPSPKALTAIATAARQLHRYPDAHAHELRERLSHLHAVPSDELAFGNGSNELIDLVCRAFAGPSDHAMIGAPSFVCYALCLRVAQVPFTEVPLDEGLYWNADRLLSALRPSTRLLFLDNPNNPTSTHLGRAELRRLLAALPEQVLPVIDEAYLHYADAEDYQSALELRQLCPRVCVLRTFSKAYGLAAVRAGYAIAPKEVVAGIERVRAPFNLSSLAQAAALAALDDTDHLARAVAHNRRERARLTTELHGLGLAVAPSQANFVHASFDRPARPLYEALLRRGVIVRPIAGVDHALRISVGLDAENNRLLQALREVLA